MGNENTTIKEGLLESQLSHLKTVSQSEFSHLKKMIPADIYLKVQLWIFNNSVILASKNTFKNYNSWRLEGWLCS